MKKTITWDIIIVLKFNQFKKKFKNLRYQMKTLSIINVAVLFKVGNQIFFFRQNKIIVCWYYLRSIKIYFYINFFIDSRQNCGSTGKFFPNLLWISQNCYLYFLKFLNDTYINCFFKKIILFNYITRLYNLGQFFFILCR